MVDGTAALYLDCDSDYVLCHNSQNYTPKRVNSPVCELHTQQQILKENLLRLSGEFLVVHENSVMCD